MTRRHLACAALTILLGAAVAAQRPAGNGGEDGADSSNMQLVGSNDLQGRSAYQPEIKRQGDRWIAYRCLLRLAWIDGQLTGAARPVANFR